MTTKKTHKHFILMAAALVLVVLSMIPMVSASFNISNDGLDGKDAFTVACPTINSGIGNSIGTFLYADQIINVTADTTYTCYISDIRHAGTFGSYFTTAFTPGCYVDFAQPIECAIGQEHTITTGPYGTTTNAVFAIPSHGLRTLFFGSTVYGPPLASFTATPSSGYAPLNVTFVDTSTGPLVDSWIWDFGDGSTVYGPNLGTTFNTYTGVGNFTAKMTVTNDTYGMSNTTQIINVLSPTGIEVKLDVRDSITGSLITDTQVGIQNTTSGVWRNSTLPSGLAFFDSTDPGFLYPLQIGQSVQLAATKTGYIGDESTFTIPYSGYLTTLYLTPTSYIPSAPGNWNLVVSVKRNLDGVPIYGANVRLQTGVGTQYDVTQQTDVNGLTTFVNVTASTSAIWSVVSQKYQDTSGSIPVITPNGTQHLNVEMVLKGGTPVTTPITPHPTSTPVDPNAPGAYPTPVDANGNPITDSGLKGFAAFGLLVDAVYAIMGIVVGIIFIWLLWLTVYMITGGKIIDKIMKRGRR